MAVRNSVISANNSDKIDMVMDEIEAVIEVDSAAGDAHRAYITQRIRWMARQFNSAGTHLVTNEFSFDKFCEDFSVRKPKRERC